MTILVSVVGLHGIKVVDFGICVSACYVLSETLGVE